MCRFPRAIVSTVIAGCICWIHVSIANAEWIELTAQESEAEHQIVMAALETHWKRSEQGWCKAVVDTHIPDQGVMEVELWWKADRVGLQVRPAGKADTEPPGDVISMEVFGPTESWRYNPYFKVNRIQGFGGKALRKMDVTFECRPRYLWLSPYRGSNSKVDFRFFLSKIEGMKFYRDESANRMRISRGPLTYEFDTLNEYAPRVFELHMESGGTLKNGKMPTRETYEVARDSHGVVYCKSMVSKTWPQGIQGEAIELRIADVLEYDSSPDPLSMRLDYNSIGALSDTQVSSFVPGRVGSWKYGKKGASPHEAEEERLRKQAENLKLKGLGNQ